MKEQVRKRFCFALAVLVAFVIFTVLVRTVDVRDVGESGSFVGFSRLNAAIHSATGVNMALYTVTDWLGIVPIAIAMSFGIMGLYQWIKRKNIFLVDRSILVLGVFYIIVIAIYLLFEFAVVNYRPILINGRLEPSYPSSTTFLVLCVMPTAQMQLNHRVKRKRWRVCMEVVIKAFVVFMVLGRFFSGVHWFTDIVAGAILSVGLVELYRLFAFAETRK